MAERDVRTDPDRTAGDPAATGTTTTSGRSTTGATRGSTSYESNLETSAGPPVGWERLNWGPIWAGVVVAVATYIILELFLFAVGAREIDIDAAIDEAALVTGLAALLALFLGGLVAGSTMKWTTATDGALHGAMTWAVTLVLFVALSVLGAGLALGGVGTAIDQLGVDVQQELTQVGEDFDVAQVADDARDASGIAVISLLVAAVAAAGGGAAGSMIGAERRAARIDLREEPKV
jgi:hypothetical protein